MSTFKPSGGSPRGRFGRFLGTLPGKSCAAAGLVVVAGAVLWLLMAGGWNPGGTVSPAPGEADSNAAARAAKAKRQKLLNYVKPTVTAEMGDVGGTYFGRKPDPAKTRHYYVAAELEHWDFLPAGSDPVCGMVLPPAVVNKHMGWKARYVQYTDATFTSRVPQPARLGILGPVLRGTVGEYIEVTFLNRAMGGVFSMHPHGVKYDKDSEGSYQPVAEVSSLATNSAVKPEANPSQGKGAAVGYGGRFTYVWYCDESSGPLPSEPSSKGWLYHSHVSSGSEINLGLEGFIIVTDPKRARTDGTPADVDREMAGCFMIFDQSGAGDDESGNGGAFDARQWTLAQRAKAAGARYAINGYIYGNLPGLEINEGERVRWYLFGLGSEQDLHTVGWHGLRVAENGQRRGEAVELLPASMKIADQVADNPGNWLFQCQVAEHMAGGMFAGVTVYPKDQSGVSRAPDEAFFGLPTTRR
jgi:hypothetical protein